MAERRAVVVPFSSVRHGEDWARWRALTDHAAPFFRPEFFALTRPLVEAGEPLVAEAWEDDVLVGVLPLVLTGRRLGALRSHHTPFFDYTGSPGGLAAIWHALRADPRWDELTLEVPTGSLVATELAERARASGCPAVLAPAPPRRYFALPGFEQKVSHKFLVNLRRCERKAGGVTLERIVAPRASDLDAAFALEAKAWKGAAGTAITADPRVAHLYRTAGRLFGKRGEASLCFLRAGSERIALLLTVEDRSTLYALKIGYDPAHAELSPGHLLVWHVAADAERRGLQRFDFVGRDDAWKHKWTDDAHEHVVLRIYCRSARGLALYGLREIVRPRLPADLRDRLRMPLRRTCQRDDVLGDHGTWTALRGRLGMGLGVRSGIKRWLRPAPVTLGSASRFPVGGWVRVRPEAEVQRTLDARDRTRGLLFMPAQRGTCGEVRRVERHVQRMRDDGRRMRAVQGTVSLEGVTCARPDHPGCGRDCPLLYRDEWLEPAEAPRLPPEARSPLRRARVRSAEQIKAGLDLAGRRDGLTYMAEMEAYAGRRLPVLHALPPIYEFGHTVPTRAPLYVLEGARCTGAALGEGERCDRACAILWHRDWLDLDDGDGEAAAAG